MIHTKHNALQSLKPNAKYAWFGYEYSGLKWSDTGSAPTESEIDAEVTRLNNAEPMRLLRLERDKRLAETDWWDFSDTTAMTDAQKTYRQALRDLPATQNPTIKARTNDELDNVTWPTKPS